MPLFGKWNPALLAAALVVAAAGCSPMDQGSMDEEKEPHYVLGKSRVNAMNFSGAIEAFEESLEANPHSAQAHYQLAILYDRQDPQDASADPAAAIYHYQQYLKYNPKADNADLIAQRIAACKQQLASNVLQLPSAPAVQQQLEKLTEENRRLHDQLTQWQAYYAAQQAAKTNPPATPNTSPPSQTTRPQATSFTPDDVTSQPVAGTGTPSSTSSTATTSTPRNPVSSRTSKSRTHTVVTGETLASIARKHDISLTSLQAANPGVNPKKLRAGQVLNLPAP